MVLRRFRPLSWIVTHALACCVFTINSSDQRPYKKRRLGGPEPPEVSEHDLAEWNLLWNTFWGKPAPECFVKVSARIPDPRTLATAT